MSRGWGAREIVLTLALIAAGCDTGVQAIDGSAMGGTGDAGAGDGGVVDAATATDAGIASGTGLPCDVAMVLNVCRTCHGNQLADGVPMHLVTWSDLTAPSPVGGTYASRALARMTDPMSPMPPPPSDLLAAGLVATFRMWVMAGAPMGNCSASGDGGVPGPYDTDDICT